MGGSERSANVGGRGREAIAWLVAPGLALIAVTYGLARFAYGLFLPEMREAFDLSPSLLGLIGAGSYLGYCVAVIISLVYTSRTGPRLMAVGAGVVAVAGMAVVAGSPVAWVLALGILVAGSSTGLASPPMAEAVARSIRHSLQDRANALINSGTSVGVALSGPAALLLTGQWRLAWTTFALVGLAVLAWNAAVMPARPCRTRAKVMNRTQLVPRRATVRGAHPVLLLPDRCSRALAFFAALRRRLRRGLRQRRVLDFFARDRGAIGWSGPDGIHSFLDGHRDLRTRRWRSGRSRGPLGAHVRFARRARFDGRFDGAARGRPERTPSGLHQRSTLRFDLHHAHRRNPGMVGQRLSRETGRRARSRVSPDRGRTGGRFSRIRSPGRYDESGDRLLLVCRCGSAYRLREPAPRRHRSICFHLRHADISSRRVGSSPPTSPTRKPSRGSGPSSTRHTSGRGYSFRRSLLRHQARAGERQRDPDPADRASLLAAEDRDRQAWASPGLGDLLATSLSDASS